MRKSLSYIIFREQSPFSVKCVNKACINMKDEYQSMHIQCFPVTQNFLNETGQNYTKFPYETGQNYTKFPVKQNNFFMTEVPIIKNHFIDLQSKSMNQWIGFYMIGTCIMKEVVRQVNLFNILRYCCCFV